MKLKLKTVAFQWHKPWKSEGNLVLVCRPVSFCLVRTPQNNNTTFLLARQRVFFPQIGTIPQFGPSVLGPSISITNIVIDIILHRYLSSLRVMHKYSTSPTPSQASTSAYASYSRSTSPLPPPAASAQTVMSATTKSYRYLRRLLKFDQMDFEFALWQMLYLFVAPQKVYRNFNYRKRKRARSTQTLLGANKALIFAS